jgi:hypothetical protein
VHSVATVYNWETHAPSATEAVHLESLARNAHEGVIHAAKFRTRVRVRILVDCHSVLGLLNLTI